MNIQQFQQLLEEKGISLSSKQLNQFEKYYQVLVEWNEKMNLTAILRFYFSCFFSRLYRN
jgi:16S rRNA (guanine527-N7)-methyltransferase